MALGVIFIFMSMKKVTNCGDLDQNCGGFGKKKLGGGFWRFLARKRAVSDSEHLETLDGTQMRVHEQCCDFHTIR